jgi:NADPH2:quinone reductase
MSFLARAAECYHSGLARRPSMKAVQVRRNGAPGEVCEVVDIAKPEPGPGQVRIRVAAGSLNFNDIDRCHGRVTTIPTPPPFTLGMDVCGVADAAGAGGEAWIGKRVVAITQMAQGGLAEYAIAPANSVFDAPPSLDDAEATAFLLPFHTTHLALFKRARLERGEFLLVHSGASGLGSAAIQLGKAAGARVLATAGGPEKAKLCAQLGAELAIDHRAQDFAAAVLDHTQEVGAHVVCDLAGGDFVEKSWKCTAREGRYLCVGFADDPANGFTGRPLRPTCPGNFSIVGVMLAYIDGLPPAIRRMGMNPFGRAVGDEVHADLLRLLAEKKIRPVVGQRIGLADVGRALDDHEHRRTSGRTVVLVGA